MTKVTGGYESMLSGKLGKVVYVQLYGKTYIRSAPRRKKNSWSPRQLLVRKRFGEINNFCGQFKYSVIPQIWNGVAEKMSGYALFLKSNMPAFAPDGSLLDPKLVRLSTGKLTLPLGLEARRSEAEPNIVKVSWPKDLHTGGIHLKDELMAISAADGQYSDILITGILRGSLGGSFELPGLPTPATHIYLFFGSRDRRNYSQSVCFEI